ncbi:hypothetical protein [Nocardioides sp. YIM 152315]|uniref:hypothetical protein n=1 Tax=Nocardioides sp. YIM 152315 TaxID=3031760 RepID=UPI0023DA4F4D|nr:hypothetical protein [Nocardioides sp. YIM 152315]MDF1603393.1 hypothetical protein [Nocardioides sp. YIM 152315]
MKIVRTWPREVPANRGHVVDGLPRYVMGDYDYRAFFEDVADDVLIVEWDMAVGAEHLADMRDLIASEPDAVHAAPYRIYLVKRDLGPHWVMRRLNAEDPEDVRNAPWVTEQDAHCHLFGFGVTYIPREVWRAYAAAEPHEMANDTRFSKWHHDNVRAEVPIPWHIRPVHLHYPPVSF